MCNKFAEKCCFKLLNAVNLLPNGSIIIILPGKSFHAMINNSYQLLVIFIDSCIVDNINIPGNDIREVNIGSIYDCQYYCQLEPACNFFVIMKLDPNIGLPRCWLKYHNGISTSGYDSNYMSGTKNCNKFTSKFKI